MKLTVLGGAPACPNPGQGSSSYLIEMAGQRWLIDCGPDTISQLRRHAEIDTIDAILISHLHSDHTIDLVPYRYGLRYMPGLDRSRIPLWLPPDGIEFLGRVANAFSMGAESADDFFTCVFDACQYVPEEGLRINGVDIRFFRTNHVVPCWAMRIESDEGTLVYLADTGPQDNLVEISKGADIFIGEGTFLEHEAVAETVDRPHLSAYETGVIAREAGVRHFVFTHYWASLGPERYLEAASKAFGGQVILAEPGTVVDLARCTW